MPEEVVPSPDGRGVPLRYQALHRALCAPNPSVIVLSFVEIHRLGSNLPYRARTDEDWWSNGPEGDPQRATWLAAGRRVQEVDVLRSRVWFVAHDEAPAVASLDEARVRRLLNDTM